MHGAGGHRARPVQSDVQAGLALSFQLSALSPSIVATTWAVWTSQVLLTADSYSLARLASVRTASTIAMSPMPLPIEILRRKMRSTMP